MDAYQQPYRGASHVGPPPPQRAASPGHWGGGPAGQRPPLPPSGGGGGSISGLQDLTSESGARARALPTPPSTRHSSDPPHAQAPAARPGLPPLPNGSNRQSSNQPSPRPGGGAAAGGGSVADGTLLSGTSTEAQLRAALRGHVVEPPSRERAGVRSSGMLSARGNRSPGRHGSRDLTPRRIGPRLPGSFSAYGDEGISVSGRRGRSDSDFSAADAAEAIKVLSEVTVNAHTKLLYLSKQVACVQWGSKELLLRLQKMTKQQAGSSVWSAARPNKSDVVKLGSKDAAALVASAQEVSLVLQQRHAGQHMIVASFAELTSSKVGWAGPVETMESGNLFEPQSLSESEEVLRKLLRYISASKEHVVVFFKADIVVTACLLAVSSGMDLNTAFLKLSHICQVEAPLAGTARYLAGLYEVCTQPSGKVIRHTKPVVISSVRIYGDHDFVRSTEGLIRVHIELHHSSYIDSTDFREQMLYRITRADDSDACIVLHFLPVEMVNDVRVIAFSTLAGEMGLITGPQPMFQLHFHTAFLEPSRPILFHKDDLDHFQSMCPVTAVEFVPGPRDEEQLSAPEVKFVRKKVKRKSNSPLGVIADFITQAGTDDKEGEEKSLESGRPVERRAIGKVYRDDSDRESRSGGLDTAYSLPDEFQSFGGDSGRVTPTGRVTASGRVTPTAAHTPTRFETPPRHESFRHLGGGHTPITDSPRRSPSRCSGRSTPTLYDPRDFLPGGGGRAHNSGRNSGNRSPRFRVPSGALMDGEVPHTDAHAAVFLNAPRRRVSTDGHITPDGRNSPSLGPPPEADKAAAVAPIVAARRAPSGSEHTVLPSSVKAIDKYMSIPPDPSSAPRKASSGHTSFSQRKPPQASSGSSDKPSSSWPQRARSPVADDKDAAQGQASRLSPRLVEALSSTTEKRGPGTCAEHFRQSTAGDFPNPYAELGFATPRRQSATPTTPDHEDVILDVIDDCTFEVFDIVAPDDKALARNGTSTRSQAEPVDNSPPIHKRAAGGVSQKGGEQDTAREELGLEGRGPNQTASNQTSLLRRPWFMASITAAVLLIAFGVIVGATKCFGNC